MVCLGNMCMDTLHKGDNDNNNNNNNNNNNSQITRFGTGDSVPEIRFWRFGTGDFTLFCWLITSLLKPHAVKPIISLHSENKFLLILSIFL